MAFKIVVAVVVAAPALAVTPDIPVTSLVKAEHNLPWYGDEEFLDVMWDDALPHGNNTVRILHITDTHFSNKSDFSPWSDRAHNLGAQGSMLSTTPAEEFASTLERAAKEDVDLVAITGDLVNFPSNESVDWALQKLKVMKAPFVFTAGTHDWHLERKFEWEESYDSQRMPNEYGTLRDLYLSSGMGVADKSFIDPRFGYAELSSGLLVVSIDNSNYQVDSQQLEFFSKMVRRGHPLLLLLHIPLYLPGLPSSWGADLVMGHPSWGQDSDTKWSEEGRMQWPAIDASVKNSTTLDFIEAVKRAAQQKVLVAVLTGHTHQNAVVPVPCPRDAETGCQTSAKQYTTRSNTEGWSRMIQLRLIPPAHPPVPTQKLQPPSPQQVPALLPLKQAAPQGNSSLWSSWVVQAALICFFAAAVLSALTGFSQPFFSSGKQGSSKWAEYESIFEPFETGSCHNSEKLHFGGTVATKLGLVKEMPSVSEVTGTKYGTLDAEYAEVLL